jgi:hypothetical protein
MEKPLFEPYDARGNLISLGSRVRIIRVPDFTWVKQAEIKSERERVFIHLLGQCKVVDDIDKYGFMGMSFNIRKGIDAGWHAVWIEPHFLLVQKTKPVI